MPKTTPQRSEARTVKLAKGWYELRSNAGFRTDAEVAVAMGVDPSTVYRLQKGEGAPSSEFMASALETFGLTDREWHKLFESVPAKQARRRAVA